MSSGVYFKQIDNNAIWMMDPSNKVARIIFRDGKTVDEIQPDWAKAFSHALVQGTTLTPERVKEIRVAAGVAKVKPVSLSVPEGTWSDDNGYSYDVSHRGITIYKANGSKWKTVSAGESNYDNIARNLNDDYKKGLLKKGRSFAQPKFESSQSSFTPAPYVPTAPSPAPISAPSGGILGLPQWWLIPTIAGGLLLVGTLIVLNLPSGTKN